MTIGVSFPRSRMGMHTLLARRAWFPTEDRGNQETDTVKLTFRSLKKQKKETLRPPSIWVSSFKNSRNIQVNKTGPTKQMLFSQSLTGLLEALSAVLGPGDEGYGVSVTGSAGLINRDDLLDRSGQIGGELGRVSCRQ